MFNTRIRESHQIGKSVEKMKRGRTVAGNTAGRMDSLTSSLIPQPISQPPTESVKERPAMPSTAEAMPSQAATEAIVITDMVGQVVLVNHGALRVLFHAWEQLTGKT